jgi:peptidyl-prolyl cis-trans isomerase SurA
MARALQGFPCTLLVLLATAPAALAEPELIDRIVATVDHQVILWSELNHRLRFELEERGLAVHADPEELARLRQEVLEDMIDEQVLILKAQKDSVQIDESEVEELLNQQFRMAKSNLSEGEFRQMLERVGLAERQLKARYRREIRHRLLYRQLRARLASRQYVTHRDIEVFRQAHRDTLPPQVSLSHINLKVRPSDEVLTERRARLAEIQHRLEAGEDFAALARLYSEDPGTKEQGGDLGCFAAGTLVPEFEEAAFRLKPGEISPPVLTQYGYHLIWLREKREDVLCASHILLQARSAPQDKERLRARLEELRRRALNGEAFSQLARQYSDNAPTAAQGGLWGTFSRDQLPAFLQPYLKGMRLGEISEPFFLEDGGHLLKINDDQATIEALIRDQRTEESVRQTIAEYRQQIHIETRLAEDFLRHLHDAPGYLSEEHGADKTAQ